MGQGLGCGLTSQPGASLLLPYFEVEIDDSLGRTTLMAVGNRDAVTALTRVVVWTNILWGDFFLVDSAGDYAQGERLVTITADQTRFGSDVCVDPPCGARNPTSFWHPQGNRMPLPGAYETRFLNGGGFDGGTELIVWTKGQIGPAECGSTAPAGVTQLKLEARSERGQPLGTQLLESRRLTRRLRVGGDEVPLAENFGCLGIEAEGRQLWVMPLMSAENRFGVGLSATPVEDFCF